MMDATSKLEPGLGTVQETLLLPLYARAAETRKPRPLIQDPKAVALVEAIDYDFDKLRAARSSIVGCCLRGLCLDGWVRDFLARHPGATVVELGPGLDDRFERVDDGRVRWYDLDLPDAMALRQRFFRESDRRTFLATSALDLGWMDRVDLGHGPLLIVAEAVIIYFSDVRRLEILEKEQAAVLERHRLVAPYDGVVSRKLADEGEWVETGTPVVELVELADPRLDVQAPQEAFARLAGEVGVKVWLDAFPGRELGGKIGVKVPVKDGVSRTFLIRIHLDDPEKLAAPGMSARAVLTFRGGEPVVQVPRDAVVRFPDGSAKVWTIREEGSAQVAEARDVTLGDSLAGTVGILAGIAEGALVVVRGNEGLRDGQAVEVLSESTSGKP
jgi:O-methyltransferase involved in polyketide biosynthesis